MPEHIKTANDADEYFFEEGCFILELSNCADDPALSLARARVEPGQCTRWHCLEDTVERYYILSGAGLVEVGDAPPARVGPGDVVLIPAMTRQRIANTGNQDLIFLALCTPRFQHANYRDLES